MAAIALTLAQLADWATALAMPPHRAELNPIAARLLEDPLLALAAKVALVALLVAVMAIARSARPRTARGLVLAGTLAGILGAWSNL